MQADLAEEIHRLHAEICQALADPKRILLLYAMADGPRSVGELADALHARPSNISQHLSVLRERGLVTGVRSGTSVRYSLNFPEVLEALDLLRGVLKANLAETGQRATQLMETVS